MLERAVTHLVSGLVEHPEDVNVVRTTNQRFDVIEVRVNPDDLGRVIGRSGRTAKALRIVVGALSEGKKVRLDVVDTDEK